MYPRGGPLTRPPEAPTPLPPPASPQISNRHLVRLERDVTSRKQTEEARCNRHRFTHSNSTRRPHAPQNHTQNRREILRPVNGPLDDGEIGRYGGKSDARTTHSGLGGVA